MAISSSRDCPKCGSEHKGKPFAVYEDGYHCFSCGATKRAERNYNLITMKNNQCDMQIPSLITNPSNFSISLLKWLRTFHVTDDLILKYGLAETTDNSLFMPVIEDNTIHMYQRRWFDPRRIMTYGTKQPFTVVNDEASKTIVITEDFISAIRVGAVKNTCCMFGTSIPHEYMVKIVKQYDIIFIWADGDKAGQAAASKLSSKFNYLIKLEKRYRSFSTNFEKYVRNILTDQDPKCYTNSEISKILEIT